jgi:hypothetical protein
VIDKLKKKMDFGAEPIFPVLCLPELELYFQTFSDLHANSTLIFKKNHLVQAA